jgi:putative heme-binding domain-containing protein
MTMPQTLRQLAVALATMLAFGYMVAASQRDDGEFKPIFNGQDLTGWDGEPSSWKVEGGSIVGTTTREAPLSYNKFFIWRGGTVKNFHLKAKVKQKGNNSGIQYRSKELKEVGPYSVGGYQCDIHPQPNYNGMLYDERGRGIVAENGQKVVIDPDGNRYITSLGGPAPADADGWNDYEIIAEGAHLTHKLNGKTAMELYDFQESERELEGILAFQIHAGPPMRVEIKDVMLKVLPDAPIGSFDPKAVPADAKKVNTPAKKAAAQKAAPRPVATESALGLKVAKGFKAELVYTVPKDEQGSWVSMTVDPKGRLIVSDQYGKLYRVTTTGPQVEVEPMPVDIGEAQGLLWAFDSLYVVVNRGQKYASGLYRAKDTDGDDMLDSVELLRKLDGGGEHGPHAVLLGPDRESLYVVAGNATKMPDLTSSLVPRFWGEDETLRHMPDGRGFMADEKAPGGFICKVDPEGKKWELVSMGYRNPYDMAFSKDGELFTYDSDMEWDMNLPWYRPTRVCMAASGSDFGYRNGSGKWPTYYPDSLPPVVNIGPGSPTGVAFGYGAKFPAKYQDALYISDWSYGKLYAVHMRPSGASYEADVEEFVSGTPLPLTDLVVNPADGAMYFAVGGRRTQSGLYRVTYTGGESTAASPKADDAGTMARATRHKLETFHGKREPRAIDVTWPYLGNADRSIRFAARVAVEWQDPALWTDRALKETDPTAAINALLAVVRANYRDPVHRTASDPKPDPALAEKVYEALLQLDWDKLKEGQKLEWLRVLEVASNRIGRPDGAVRDKLLGRLEPLYPARSRELNIELCQLLVAYQSPTIAAKTLALMDRALTQEEQIDYARCLRLLNAGWNTDLRRKYLLWFPKAANFKGGNSFEGFLKNIKNDTLATMSESEKAELKDAIDARPETNTKVVIGPPREFIKEWNLDDLVALADKGLKGRDFDRGRAMFAAAQCYACHRFGNDGGAVGPDLTGLAGRFNVRDLFESIVLPSKTISDQYEAVMIATDDGRVVTGRIINLHGDAMTIMPNMLEPNSLVNVDRRKVEEMRPSPVSMMPEGLLNTLKEDEVLDLMAYLMSRGDREAPYFQQGASGR